MLRVGLTGGIGSGKSTVARIFATIGISTYDSDKRAKLLMHENEEVRQGIIQLFGNEVYDSDGTLQRKLIADKVFGDPELLKSLNAIVHPAVGRDFVSWCESQWESPYVLKEAAIIFEIGLEKKLDAVILVTAPEETRIQRVMKRDGVSKESVKARIANQWPDERKAPLSDFVIVNDGDRPLLRQVMEIHNFLCEKTPK